MKNWTTVTLSILTVMLAAYAGYLSVENRSLKRRLANNAPAFEKKPVETLAEAESEEPEIEAEQSEETGSGRRFADGERPTREEMMERRKEQMQAQMERILATFDDPELRMDMIERAMERIDRGYAELFRRLKLPPEEVDALKVLMAEQGILRFEGQARTRFASEEDREAIKEDYRNQRELLAGDIEALLGEDNAAKFKQYSNTLEYRDDVESFERSLSYTETPLTKRQSEGLVNAYAAVDKDFEYTYDMSEMGRRGGGNQFTQEIVDTYYQEREVYDAMLLEQAARVLNEAQLASLADQQISDRERDLRQAQLQLEAPQTDGGRGSFGGFSGRGGGGGRGGSGGGGGGRRGGG